jgi:hypothetical protein
VSASQLFLGVLFGSIGLGLFVYGRKQKTIAPFVCGLGLMVVPYFIASTWLLIVAGITLIAIPYFFRA